MTARYVVLVHRVSKAMEDFASGMLVPKILVTKAWPVTIPIRRHFSDVDPVPRDTEGTVSTASPQLVNSDLHLVSKYVKFFNYR